MTPVARIYEKQLLDSGVMTAEKLVSMKKSINDILEDCYTKSKTLEYKAEDWVTKEWAQLKELPDIKEQVISGVPLATLKDLG
jgi:2-oxoglutarate dehydrogenase complex dehydrogenase (E1) component-like enzyme